MQPVRRQQGIRVRWVRASGRPAPPRTRDHLTLRSLSPYARAAGRAGRGAPDRNQHRTGGHRRPPEQNTAELRTAAHSCAPRSQVRTPSHRGSRRRGDEGSAEALSTAQERRLTPLHTLAPRPHQLAVGLPPRRTEKSKP